MTTTAENNNGGDLYRFLMWVFLLALVALVVGSLSGCRTVLPPERVVQRTDTVRTHSRDSIYIHYTDTVRERTSGDTVFVENIKWRTTYREIYKADTVVRLDSIATTQVVKVAEMNNWQRSFFWIGIVFSVLLLLYITIKIVKWLK